MTKNKLGQLSSIQIFLFQVYIKDFAPKKPVTQITQPPTLVKSNVPLLTTTIGTTTIKQQQTKLHVQPQQQVQPIQQQQQLQQMPQQQPVPVAIHSSSDFLSSIIQAVGIHVSNCLLQYFNIVSE